MKITLSELKQIIRNIIRESAEEIRLNQINNKDIKNIIQLYLNESIYDVKNTKGNCAFFAKDIHDWFKGINQYKNNKSQQSIDLTSNHERIEILYMPQDVPTANQLISAGIQEEIEDHIVPIIDNHIIDFVYQPNQGLSYTLNRKVKDSQTNPIVVKYDDSLFHKTGLYGQHGYLNKQVKDVNQYTNQPIDHWTKGNIKYQTMPNYISTFISPNLKKKQK